jgi:hypothetical protein
MWTLTDIVLPDFPVTVGVKGFFTKTTVGYKQTVSSTVSGVAISADGTIEFADKMYGVQALVSKKLFLFEPYVGLGYIRANGTLTVTAAGAATIFSPSFTTGQTATSKPSSAQILVGSDFQILFFSLGAEYQRAFSKSSYTGRLSFRF